MIGLPYIALGASALILAGTVGGYLKGRGDGREGERGKWEAVQAKAATAAAAMAQERQDAVDAASAAAARSDALLEVLRARNAQTTKVYYAQNPAANVACLDPGRLQHIAESDAAAAKAASAPSAK